MTATAAARVDLGPLLAPSTIAVVRASADEAKPGGWTLAFLQRYGYPGRIYPINPGRSEIAGLPALASLEELPESVDLVIFAIAAAQVPDGLEKAGHAGGRSAIVFSSVPPCPARVPRGGDSGASPAPACGDRAAPRHHGRWGRTASGTSTSSPAAGGLLGRAPGAGPAAPRSHRLRQPEWRDGRRYLRAGPKRANRPRHVRQHRERGDGGLGRCAESHRQATSGRPCCSATSKGCTTAGRSWTPSAPGSAPGKTLCC